MKICCVFNYNPLYRYPIYHAMDEKLHCDFFFGDTVFENIKSFEAAKLDGFQCFLNAKRTPFSSLVWHKGIMKVLKRKYTHYIITGAPMDIMNWLIIAYSKLTGKKVYFWTHGFLSPVTSSRGKILGPLFFKYADGIFLYGAHAKPYMVGIGCKPERIHIIHNSLDTIVQTNIYNKIKPSNIYTQHFNNDAPVAIYIGRLQKRKKVGMLLEAIAHLKNEGKKVNAVIVGPVEDDRTLQSEAKSLGLDNQVWFYGKSYEETVTAELLYNASVCVCPAEVGLTAIHSLSYGTPVVTNDDFEHQMPEFEAIQDYKTGSFYRTGSVDSLAYSIWGWCGKDANKRDETRQTSRDAIIKEWSIDYQIDLLMRTII